MVSAFLDHSSLAVTTTYLRRLEGVKDHSWERVAESIGGGKLAGVPVDGRAPTSRFAPDG